MSNWLLDPPLWAIDNMTPYIKKLINGKVKKDYYTYFHLF